MGISVQQSITRTQENIPAAETQDNNMVVDQIALSRDIAQSVQHISDIINSKYFSEEECHAPLRQTAAGFVVEKVCAMWSGARGVLNRTSPARIGLMVLETLK